MKLLQSIILLCACILSAPVSFAGERDAAQNLTIITSPPLSKRNAVERRYRFVLPKFVSRCDDVESEDRAADMLAVLYREIRSAGLDSEEGMLELTNNLYSMTNQIRLQVDRANSVLRCAEIWSMYLVVRQEGLSQNEARNQIAELTGALYGLIE